MKLFRVSVERTLMVMAESKAAAEREADRMTATEDGADADYVRAVECKSRSDIPSEWASSIPWGEPGDRTCADIVPEPVPPPAVG